MSRASSSSSGRALTLTEELERLEQSITLTLQEIDHNFSKAHRIVTASILPIVEQYGEHSKSVWEASKFWKQFFEASANVSLSGYEELVGEDGETTTVETTLEDTTSEDYSSVQDDGDATVDEQSGYHDQQQQQQQQQQRRQHADDTLLLDEAEMSGSTPRPPATKSLNPQQQQLFEDFDSPYEKLRRKLKGGGGDNNNNTTVRVGEDGEPMVVGGDEDDETMELPAHTTGTATTRLPDMSMTPRSSSLLLDEPTMTLKQGDRQLQQTLFRQQQQSRGNTKTKDPLLHRVLDKNYRIQATPHKGAPPLVVARGLSPEKDNTRDRSRRALWADSPTNSPEIAIPKLRSDLYMSPAKARGGRRQGARPGDGPPRTPGVSVQTPATARKTRDVFAEEREGESKGKGKGREDEITWDSDSDEDFGGMSPPKTIQFALPQSRLMQTPAREASRRIVEDILVTAGAAPEESSEYSPTMVKMNQNILDDTF